MHATSRPLLSTLCAFTLATGCGDKGQGPPPPPTKAPPPTTEASAAATTTPTGDTSVAPTPSGPAAGEGTIVIVGDTAVQELALTPYAPAGDTAAAAAAPVAPDAQGRVKAGIYKVPGGSYIAVPDRGTVYVRPDESRGVMIGGLPFQLDTDVRYVAEADPDGLSFTRAASADAEAMPRFGVRYLAPGVAVEGPAILEHRDFIHQIVLHTDLTADSKNAFIQLVGRDLSDHFEIDFDGTLYQTLDVAANGYHAGDANNRSIGVTLNNYMRNLARAPDAPPYPDTLPAGTSLTPPAANPTPTGPCKLVASDITCEVKGMAFGIDAETAVVSGDGLLFTTLQGGDQWTRAVAPFAPNGVRDVGGDLVAYGPSGSVARSKDYGKTWERVESGSTATWRDAWVEPATDDGVTLVLVGDDGAIARSTDAGQSFTAIASTAKGDFLAIGKVGEGRLVASLGARAFESKDVGASWTPLTEALDLATLVPPPGSGRCRDRLPAPGEVCLYTTTTATWFGADAFVLDGETGVAYRPAGYAVTSDAGYTWEAAVSPERAAELARHPRQVSNEMAINGAKVRTYGYTEAQYKTLGTLVRTLATVFPALTRVAGLDAEGNVIGRVLDAPETTPGILAHWHWEAQRWDPGPGFDWSRLVKELAERPR